MNFFEHQDRARRNTKWLVVYFIAAVALMIAAIYAVFAAAFLRGGGSFWHTELFAGVALGTVFVILCGSLTKTLALRQGGSAVASMLGGRPINTNTTDPDERKLLNVVEEVAIASGISVPTVYLLPEEEGINAFAAGRSPADAVIGVTRGCMTLLTREELQGVIAHEFSHVLNGDMRLNVRLIGLVFGIFCLSQIGRILIRTSGRRSGGSKKGGNPLPLIGIALMIIGAIGVFFGRLIKSAVSRQREFLADAAAVQFTRNPAGLAGALKKIGGLLHGSRIDNAHAEEASHLFFSNALASSWSSLMATHPPLAERIKRLDPSSMGASKRWPKLKRPNRCISLARSRRALWPRKHLWTPSFH
jgi:Zn-dependent protease with chaperone function